MPATIHYTTLRRCIRLWNRRIHLASYQCYEREPEHPQHDHEHLHESPDDPDAQQEVVDKSVPPHRKREFPEEPTTCCMSGCANCVWLDYAEKLSEYYKDGGEAAIREIEERVQDPNMKAFLLTEMRMRLQNKDDEEPS